LQEYKPLIQEFWRDGLFGPLDQRFLRLIDRSHDMKEEVDWTQLDINAVYGRFYEIYNNRSNVAKEAYFDSMTHFEFKTLLPALLHVEDRMSMAHGLESRVPFLDHPVVEFAATIPPSIKFTSGELKRLLRLAFADRLPSSIRERKDKMGFPVPLNQWLKDGGRAREFVHDTLGSARALRRDYLAEGVDIGAMIGAQGAYNRNLWGLLSLELFQQQFIDG